MGRDVSKVLRDLGRRIAELRAGRGMTQEQLAGRLDVNVQYLQRVERGVENLTVASLARFADLLGTQVGDLFAAPATRTRRPGRPRKGPTEGLPPETSGHRKPQRGIRSRS
jgi:transcriptional regulator with XRE-family HTH domain